ncbi:PEP/pyruvate-binding domain-containing protein [Arthrobacter sp. SLBN-53]|uniref:PEP/pyruvate-binding domain-containing protein n=1 Tax=Arthrobacter sp. SLBN-53 TaxID=2768412 RepID=UPI0011526018|nr:PEP/pyruvate-binding domain-containing protein [Arthrobacter sp. SLBN-53]TQK31182.1 pyruvate,water dikinase [Arthrobacter sp. SLBN-53]
MVTSPIVEFDDITDSSLGGKAAGLAELRRIGLAVPVGFVLADAAQRDTIVDAVGRFTQMASAGAVPVAVRSSAVGEDGVEQSFAGQYETVLNVGSVDEFIAAVRRCADSVDTQRASAYSGDDEATMHLVVQQMVDARAAGVVFTADPATGRRDLMILDSVAGLGEALVDGSASSDHLVLNADGTTALSECAGTPILSTAEVTAIRTGALQAARHWGMPMDLEWAIDRAGTLWWLQARPITTLPGDLNEMDSPVAGVDHVYTRCNIGEMMPGAYCPLTASVSGYAIDFAMQTTQVVARAQPRYETPWLQVGYFYGHMFLNLTEGTALSSGILGNSREQFSMSICGRVIDELEAKPAQPFIRKLGNTIRLVSHALSVGPAIRRLDDRIARFRIPATADAREMLGALESGVELYCDVTLIHVRSSSRAAVAANVLESTLIGRAVRQGRTETDGRAEAMRLMAGADDVESALMLQQLRSVVATLAADQQEAQRFLAQAPDAAVRNLCAAGAGSGLRAFLGRHGHRGYRELCMRDPSWADDPAGLGSMMQAMLRASLVSPERVPAPETVYGKPKKPIELLARLARGGARGREQTKAKMALMAHALKRGYRGLGELLQRTGRLPDADLVFFFDRSELTQVVGDDDITELVRRAAKRRDALPYQDALEFDDVSVGRPRPRIATPHTGELGNDDTIVGRPASRGVVEGTVRVAKSVHDAGAVCPGEILVAPVTDVGWTPYFTVIAALVTDIGSSVSHGAVVAREYGLPCVVNTLVGTQTFQTGDRIRVDGDRGLVTRIR